MSKGTNIEWCDDTVNPTMGCDGCELWDTTRHVCYAGVLHERYGGRNPGFAPSFKQVTMFPGRMAKAAKWSDLIGTDRPTKPWLNGLPRLIFVSDMSDALSGAVTFEYLKVEIIDVARSAPHHCWLWLTKRPSRMAEFAIWLEEERGIGWPENLWAGTSITTMSSMQRVTALKRVPAAVRFLSVEPMVEPIDLGALEEIHWVIVGGESGPKARWCAVDWIMDVARQCREASVPVFVKQLGSNSRYLGGLKSHPMNLKDPKGGDWSEWPVSLRTRQMPAPAAMIVGQ